MRRTPGGTSDTGWVNLTGAAGWTVTTLRYRRLGGVMYVQVNIANTSGGTKAGSSNLASAALPSGPGATLLSTGYNRIQVVADGTLQTFDAIANGDGIIANASFPV
jgi:hypothetical protein